VASLGLNLDEQKAVDRFRTSVIEPSMTALVVLDFWAEWCGPCKALTPLLEKVAAEYADRGVLLAKVNVDEEPFIAQQFQVRTIPTVYAIFQGQPVADLTQSRSESQLKAQLDELLAKLPMPAGAPPAEDITPLLAMGEEVLGQGEAERAAAIFAQIAEIDPVSGAAHGGLIRALTALGELDQAQAAASALPPDLAGDGEVLRALTALELARSKPDDAELAALKAAAIAPENMAARLAYAEAAFAAGERDAAVEALLAMVGEDPTWEEGAARAKLLQIFAVVGLEDAWVAAQRRRLSLLLFG
jgi:putative thioredoxin